MREGEYEPIDEADIYADMHEKYEAMYPRMSQKLLAMTICMHFIAENLQLKQDNQTLQLALNGLRESKMTNQTLTVYIIDREGIENPKMQDLIEVFSGTILASGTPDKIAGIVEKRGYQVVPKPDSK